MIVAIISRKKMPAPNAPGGPKAVPKAMKPAKRTANAITMRLSRFLASRARRCRSRFAAALASGVRRAIVVIAWSARAATVPSTRSACRIASA